MDTQATEMQKPGKKQPSEESRQISMGTPLLLYQLCTHMQSVKQIRMYSAMLRNNSAAHLPLPIPQLPSLRNTEKESAGVRG